MWNSSADNPPAGQPLQGLLTHRGLLTEALQQRFESNIFIRLLQESDTPEGSYLRRVIIMCGAMPLVYAESLIPSQTLLHHSWLTKLGDRSLGASLAEHGMVTRGDYEYRPLTASDHIYQRAVQSAGVDDQEGADLWARRFTLSLDSCDIQVTEVFLPMIDAAL